MSTNKDLLLAVSLVVLVGVIQSQEYQGGLATPEFKKSDVTE